MKELLYLSRIAKKLHIQQYLYRFLLLFYARKKGTALDNWNIYLKQIHPDTGESSFCENLLIPEKDRVDLEIIIPVYNTERYIKECIDSALSQETKYSFRVVVVNDGSTDRSPEIINTYLNDPRVLIINQENRGFSGARNRALEKICGRYVTFLDSDDRLPKDAVEKLMNIAYNGNFDLVGGGYRRFGSGRFTSTVLPQTGQFFGFPWGKVYRADLWKRMHFPRHYWYEDTVCGLIIHDMALSKTTIQEPVYEYRINRKSITFSSRGNPKEIDTLWVTLRLIEDREKLGLPFDNKFLDRILKQCRINTIRICSLGDSRANMANFQASRELYFCYHKAYQSQIKANQPMEEAIIHNNYWQFILACLFL
jgi:glycosyltransferase involved in cell wall biosynthesis